MKTALQLFILMLSINVLFAQQRATLPSAYKDYAQKSNYVRPSITNPDLPVFKVPNPIITSTLYMYITEDIIGTTFYDLQTNSCLQNRMYCYDDGSIGAVWTMGMQASAFPDRGTGYNYYDGSLWQAEPTARI